MTLSRTEKLVARLRELQAATPDIEASVIVSVDGLTIASALPQDAEEDRVSAMSAAMLSLGERIAMELGRGGLEEVATAVPGLRGRLIDEPDVRLVDKCGGLQRLIGVLSRHACRGQFAQLVIYERQ